MQRCVCPRQYEIGNIERVIFVSGTFKALTGWAREGLSASIVTLQSIVKTHEYTRFSVLFLLHEGFSLRFPQLSVWISGTLSFLLRTFFLFFLKLRC